MANLDLVRMLRGNPNHPLNRRDDRRWMRGRARTMEGRNRWSASRVMALERRERTMREMRKHGLYRVVAALVAGLTIVTSTPITWAASHREAPLIALDPAADNTDVYAFRSWEDPSKVVFIANVIPGQEPGDGPNYFNFDDEVLYAVNIDNNQDGIAEDIVYEFRFKTETRPILGSLL